MALSDLASRFLSALGSRRAQDLGVWQDQAAQAVEASVARAKAEVDAERKEMAQIYEAFLEGDPAAWLSKWAKETQAHWDSRVKVAVDFSSSFLDVLSTLYGVDSGPERRFVDNPRIFQRKAVWWHRWAQKNQLDLFMREVDRWTRFHGTVLIEVRFVLGNALDPLPWVKLVLHRPYQADVHQDPLQPDQAESLRLFAGRATQTKGAQKMLYHFWTERVMALCDDWTVQATIPNIYRTIPVVRVPNRIDGDRYWVDGLAPKMIPFNLEFNRLLTGFGDSVEHMDGQPVLKSVGTETMPYTGLDTQIHLPNKDDDYWIEKPGSDIPAKIAGLQELLDYWSISLGLPAGFLRAKLQQSRESPSGVAIIATQLGLSQDREVREKIFRSIEEQIVDLVGLVWLRHTGQDVRTKDFGIAYPSVSRSLLSVSDRRENWRFEIDSGLVPRWMVLKDMRPGLSEGAARLIVAEADRDKEKSDGGRSAQDRDDGIQDSPDPSDSTEDGSGGQGGRARAEAR